MNRVLIRSNEYREQQWKNGGGITREIAAHDFWRLSIATIDRDGPFSSYRGCDRTIVAIDGDPVELTIDDETIVLARFEPVEFAGESPASAHLTSSAARDLNMMTARDKYIHKVAIVTGTERFLLREDEFAFVVAVEGTAEIDEVLCDAGDTLAIGECGDFTVTTRGHAAVILVKAL